MYLKLNQSTSALLILNVNLWFCLSPRSDEHSWGPAHCPGVHFEGHLTDHRQLFSCIHTYSTGRKSDFQGRFAFDSQSSVISSVGTGLGKEIVSEHCKPVRTLKKTSGKFPAMCRGAAWIV